MRLRRSVEAAPGSLDGKIRRQMTNEVDVIEQRSTARVDEEQLEGMIACAQRTISGHALPFSQNGGEGSMVGSSNNAGQGTFSPSFVRSPQQPQCEE